MNLKVQRTFTIGDTWLYYKIYCGTKTIDDVLLQVIQPITCHLLKKQCINQWFFIRYADPDPHVRVRLRLENDRNLSTVMMVLRDGLKAFFNNGQVWNVQLHTYQRELERYGSNSMVLAETLFFRDSTQALEIIKCSDDETTRFVHCFHWVAHLITQFALDTSDQLDFLERLQKQFKEEFQVKKQANRQLNLKYKNLESKLYNENPFILKKNEEMYPIIQEFLKLEGKNLLEVPKESLLASFIHMTINRTFKSQQRLYEMMIYDFLNKMNKAKMARYGRL